ncbi:MAG: hypothetical protein WDM96_13295 [Lacunisphaera sp.]
MIVVRRRLNVRLKKEAGIFVAPAEEEMANTPRPDDTLVLEPFVVKGEKPDLPPPVHGTPVQEFFRAGTVWGRVGSRFTISWRGVARRRRANFQHSAVSFQTDPLSQALLIADR